MSYRCNECGDVWLDAGYHGCRRMARVFMVALAAFAFLACGPQPTDTAAPPQQEDRGAFVQPMQDDARNYESLTTTRPVQKRVSRSRGSTSLTAPVHKVRPAPPVNEAGVTMSALLRRIGGCESSGRPDGPLRWTVVNRQGSSASGAFQILDGTWASWAAAYGKNEGAQQYRRAMYAPPAVQTVVAERALAVQGTRPWLASRGCWR